MYFISGGDTSDTTLHAAQLCELFCNTFFADDGPDMVHTITHIHSQARNIYRYDVNVR